MNIRVPDRGDLIAVLPVFCAVCPLQRPRLNFFNKKIYQPKDNQKELLKMVSNFEPMKIERPIIIDTYINLVKVGKNKYPTSPKCGDDDNLRKAISDALQANSIILDDRLILGGENYKSWGPENLCIIKIYEVGEILDVSA